MKKCLTLLLLLFVVGFSACHYEEKPATIAFSPDSVNLGTVIIGDSVTTFDVEIQNIGDKKLFINKVESSCGCTTVDYPHDSIEGGGSAIMHVTFNSKEFFPSEIVREIEVYSNDVNSPQTFYFKVKVQYGSAKNDQCGTYNIYSHS